ncbi:MAG: VapC toxin family PIN domain ribonuclease [Verrucomicrobia bacterium]|nr:MAG: VapC toxin family PIN domain ribonuclease [Verrucomicrobiota bacterium]
MLLDTNVLSELARPRPNRTVTAFLDSEISAHISVVTLHELVFGARRVSDPLKRQRLLDWIGSIENQYQSSLIPVSREIARTAADFRADQQHHGRVLHIEDALIAATAAVYSLTLVTRNTRDFESIDVQLINPWKPKS